MTTSHHHSRPLAGSLKQAIVTFPALWPSFLIATALPLAIIAGLRWFSDDYTGDQYSVVIGLISIFTTMMITRIAVSGWDRSKVRLVSFYNAIFSRYLSGIGLLIIYFIHTVPLILSWLIIGLIIGKAISGLWLIVALPLFIFGLVALVHGGFAIFALMDDMSLSVGQAYRISGRLARKYWRHLAWRSIVGLAVFMIFIMGLSWLGTGVAQFMQDARIQLAYDAIISWVFVPWLIFYAGTIYQRLIEAYE